MSNAPRSKRTLLKFLGEGIEREEKDFAAEVAEQLNKK